VSLKSDVVSGKSDAASQVTHDSIEAHGGGTARETWCLGRVIKCDA